MKKARRVRSGRIPGAPTAPPSATDGQKDEQQVASAPVEQLRLKLSDKEQAVRDHGLADDLLARLQEGTPVVILPNSPTGRLVHSLVQARFNQAWDFLVSTADKGSRITIGT